MRGWCLPGVPFRRAPVWCPSGGGGTREARGTVAESLVGRSSMRRRTVTCSNRRESSRFDEGGGKLDRSRARGVLNPCVRESKARTGRFWGENWSLAKVCFLLTRAIKERRTGKDLGAFVKDSQGFGRLDAGSRPGFTSSRPPPRWTSIVQIFFFLHDVWP